MFIIPILGTMAMSIILHTVMGMPVLDIIDRTSVIHMVIILPIIMDIHRLILQRIIQTIIILITIITIITRPIHLQAIAFLPEHSITTLRIIMAEHFIWWGKMRHLHLFLLSSFDIPNRKVYMSQVI